MALTVPATQIFIVRDDLDEDGLNLGGGQWSNEVADYYFNDRIVWPEFSQNISSPRGSFSYTFEGTSLRVIGHTAPADNDQVFRVTIDDHAPYNTSTDDKNEHYKQWYQSPQLSEGRHTIKFDRLNGQTLDYMVVAPSLNTPLKRQTLMVDDSYSGIQYSKGWQAVNNATFVDSWIWGGNNFMNTTHTTSTVGDTMTFSYTGTNASVFGMFLKEQVGSLAFTYSIDDGTDFSSGLTSTGPDGSEKFINQQPHYKLFETGPLSAGNHTLTMTLTDCIGQVLIVDYILYTPSFDNIASMPNLTASPPNPPDVASQTGTSSSKKAGAIAGGVVGGVVLLIIVAFLLWWLRRRSNNSPTSTKGKRLRPEPLTQLDNSSSSTDIYAVEPFSAATSSELGSLPPMSAKPGSASLISSPPGLAAPPVPSPTPAKLSSPAASENEQLRRQVQQLSAENARLAVEAAGAAPPAYN